jgi:hypothetical protein
MKKIFFLLAAGGLLTGCGTDYRVRSAIDTSKPRAMIWSDGKLTYFYKPNKWIESKTYVSPLTTLHINPYTYNPAGVTDYSKRNQPDLSKSFYFQASGGDPTKTADQRKYYRNELQNALFQVIHENTEQHLSEFKATENDANLLLGAATIGLSGGASVAAGATAKALAAATTGTAGARSLVNEQVFRNTFSESIIALIDKDQSDFLDILRQRQTNSIFDYTVEAAIMDAKEYEIRGSTYHGLALLQKAVQNQVAGGTNSVPVKQYLQQPKFNGSITGLTLTHGPAAPKTATISGADLGLLDLSQIKVSEATTLKVNGAYRSDDNTLNLELSTPLAAAPAAPAFSATVSFSYLDMVSGAKKTIDLLVSGTIN